MLDADIKAQLAQYLEMMEGDVLLKISAGSDEVSRDMVALVDELATMSSHIKVEKAELERTPSFSVNRVDEDTGIVFARSEEHTSELQSRGHLVCRLLLEKKKKE